MKQWVERFVTLQPAVYRGAVVGVITLLINLGVVISPQLSDSIVGFISTVSVLVAAVWIRDGVTPNAKVLAYVPDPDIPRVIAPGEAVTTARDSAILDAVATVGRHAAPE